MDVADSIAAAVLQVEGIRSSFALAYTINEWARGPCCHLQMHRRLAYYCGKPNGRDATAYSATVIEAVYDSDNDDIDAVLDRILGGESNTPIRNNSKFQHGMQSRLVEM